MIPNLAGRIAGIAPQCQPQLAGTRIMAIMPSIPRQGMERANLQIMRMMRQRGAEVLFVVEANYGEVIQREVARIGCRSASASILRSFEERLHIGKSPQEMFGVVRAWARAARQIDAIYRHYRPTHIYVTSLAFFLYALPTLWRSRQPVIFRLPNPPASGLTKSKQRISDWLWRHAVLPACDVAICNSQYTLTKLRQICRDIGSAQVIHNCLAQRPAVSSDAPRLDLRRFNIAYLGRIRAEKGVKQLFDAALRLVREQETIDFYFAGEYHWKNPFAEALIAEAHAQHLGHRIHFTGEIEDVFGLLKQCDLHVCPSTSPGESFPNVLLEAKSLGLPSVVFPTAGIPECVSHKLDGYVCAEPSADALYTGIRYFFDSPQRLEIAGKVAAASLARFAQERIGDQWAALFKSTDRPAHVA